MASFADLGLDFDLLEVGNCGKIVTVPKREHKSPLPRKTLPVGLPPVLPSMEEDLENRFLSSPERLPIHDFTRTQRFWPREQNPDSLFHMENSPLQTTIKVIRDPKTGKLLGYTEEHQEGLGMDGKSSMSMKRPPGPISQDVRGSTLNMPFWPGGIDLPVFKELDSESSKSEINLDSGSLLTTAPGMTSGMNFDPKVTHSIVPSKESNVINVADILVDDFDDLDLDMDEKEENNSLVEEGTSNSIELQRTDSLENLVKVDTSVQHKEKAAHPPREVWAQEVDINHPVDDFHQRVPNMAYTWPFELDVFQKQAVIHLENHDSVFVAAHTSAGKTVVAEYAIALSLRHMTRTIYTSPIKALSNQKFRDFKQRFEDVGLVTGDVQINQTASCLIMTTEILRSMLYNGSDVIRDLEWVIFDEVHYINDAERGVVWEEVLIMLPQHVNIILLSATVPNTMEFADWIGRTKRKKIFVISTSKRPVPLEHYLYTGNSGKTSNELFLIVNEKKEFLTKGYAKAVEAKKDRASKSSQNFGAKGLRGGHPAQDKNVWISIIDMLKKKDKLPVVAFTFSKKKIEDNVNNLQSLDLTTAKEKSAIHIFFQKCISKLKEPDRKLPQVCQMEDHLKRGIGMHHSGILPILKEVVEMCFQENLVKVLFATETFAMGVNMPARTVVFDSIQKHDGTCRRDLHPGEYIQMAGRAGRRGLDTTGTVIILCKGDVPEMSDLHKMMLGKPTKLESKFRLTYSMILNLLRVEQLRVQDMIKRSFSEFNSQKDLMQHKAKLESLHKQIAQLKNVECFLCSADLETYYERCYDYQELRQHLQKTVLSHPATIKLLTPGRVVVLEHSFHRNILGVVLQSHVSSSSERSYTCLTLCDKKETSKEEEIKSESSLSVQPVINTGLHRPEGVPWHNMIKVKSKDIAVVTVKSIRIDADKIINDIRKREQPRFRNDPPGQAVSIATQELMRLVEANPEGLQGLDPLKDLHLRDMDLVEEFRSLNMIKDGFKSFQCVNCAHFHEHFQHHAENMKLRNEYKKLKFLLSDESLTLLPEYEQRVKVLKTLGYIDEKTGTVQLKGRVACEISSHEVMITELLFDNVLTDLHPTEIAALLSSMVFEQKNCSEPNLTYVLQKGKDTILEKAEQISRLQKEVGMQFVGDYAEEFKFNLMEVVFEWARGLPFSEITNLTDVQEGIIVRCIQRLNETLRDVRNAARIIGDPVLYQKMEEASIMIKRDIVFAASLYTQ